MAGIPSRVEPPNAYAAPSAPLADGSRNYVVPLSVLTTLFFMWGGLTSLNDVLIPHLKGIFQLSYARALAVQHETLAKEVADLEQHLLALADLDNAGKQLHAKGWCDRATRVGQGLMLLEAAARDVAAGQGRGLLVLGAFMRRHYLPGGWREQLAATSPAAGFDAIVRKQPVGLDEALAALRTTGLVGQP